MNGFITNKCCVYWPGFLLCHLKTDQLMLLLLLLLSLLYYNYSKSQCVTIRENNFFFKATQHEQAQPCKDKQPSLIWGQNCHDIIEKPFSNSPKTKFCICLNLSITTRKRKICTWSFHFCTSHIAQWFSSWLSVFNGSLHLPAPWVCRLTARVAPH